MTTATVHAAPASERRVDELAHLPALAGEVDQRDHGEGELQAQDDLAQDQERARAMLAVQRGDDHRRHDRDESGDEPAEPGGQPDVEEPLHHDLAGQRAR